MWVIINIILLKLVENKDFNNSDNGYVKELLHIKNILCSNINWHENDPFTLNLINDVHPTIILKKVFEKLEHNKSFKLEEKIYLENFLIKIKWFCEKLKWSKDLRVIEPMDTS